MTKPCLFCGNPLHDDNSHWVCFNHGCVACDQGHPKKLYANLEEFAESLDFILIYYSDKESARQIIMSGLYMQIDKIAYWRGDE